MWLMNRSNLKINLSFYFSNYFYCSIEYGLGSGSDFLGFDQLVGSSNMDIRYKYNLAEERNMPSYPLYHTSYEVFSMVKKFVDPAFLVNGEFVDVYVLIISIYFNRNWLFDITQFFLF